MSLSLDHQSADPTIVYSSLSIIELRPSQRSAQSIRTVIQIVQKIAVDIDRTSQVVIGKVIETDEEGLQTGLSVIVKFYDPDYMEDDPQWPGGRVSKCAWRMNNEITAYKTLLNLQGKDLAIFYGDYIYQRPINATSHRPITALLIQYIDSPTLIEFGITRQLTAEERTRLKDKLFSALEEFHRRGVYHLDIRGSNILYDHEKEISIWLDWEHAQFRGGKNDAQVKGWESDDWASLHSELVSFGIEDPRSSTIPSWAVPS